MQTICDLKIELKKRGIKGISGLNKSQLIALLASGKSAPKKETPKESPKEAPKPAPKPAPPPTPKLLKMKELSPKTDESNKYKTTSLKTLVRLEFNTEKLLNDSNVITGEKINAEKKLKEIEKAIALRPEKDVKLERLNFLQEKDLQELNTLRIDLEKKIKNRKLPATDMKRYRAQLTRVNRVIKLKTAELNNKYTQF
jgi:hypothetical protein